MTPRDWVTAAALLIGGFFFLAGTAGMLRFPDLHSRLHALTKADNLGLGFVIIGLMVQANSLAAAAKLLLIWSIALAASGTSAYLIANNAVLTRSAEGEDRVTG
jgi:multicomponent Na+:H+ antiporter subunit G